MRSSIDSFINDVKDIKQFSNTEALELIEKYKQTNYKDEELANALSLGFIKFIISRTSYFGKDNLSELIYAGIQGVKRAAKKFNPNLNTKFSSYAKFWIDLFIKIEYKKLKGRIEIEGNDNLECYHMVDYDNPYEICAKKSDKKYIYSMLSKLTYNEAKVIKNKYLSKKPKNNVEISRILNISAERVRQIDIVALNKITKIAKDNNE